MSTPVQVQANTSNSGIPSYGLLTWWTIHQKLHKVTMLKTSSLGLLVPDSVVKGIVGATPTNAFSKATNLGASGVPDFQPNPDLHAHFVTRKADGDSMILAWELVERGKKRLKVEQIGVLTLESDDLVFTPDPVGFVAHKPPSQNVVDAIRSDFERRIGAIDDIKLRSLVLNWLEDKHRVCLRNTGGLYFIPGLPNPPDHQQLINDCIAIRNWFVDQGIGSFSLIEIFNTPATSTSDLIESSLLELQAEIEEIGGKVDGYASSGGMNAGSRSYSTGTALDRIREIESKITTLQSALGDNLTLAVEMIQMVKSQAVMMKVQADQEVQAFREGKPSKEVGKRRKVQIVVK
jgi:hypothetical protein